MPAYTKATRRISKEKQKEFIKKLNSVETSGRAVETEVIAPAYRDVIETYFGDGHWDFDPSTDGFFSAQESLLVSLRLLLEAKSSIDFTLASERAKIVAQCIYYMKAYEKKGHDQPTVIFGADKERMFVVYAPPLREYLTRDLDWNLAPSSAAQGNPQLVEELAASSLLNTFVYQVSATNFDLNEVMYAVDKLAENNGEHEKIKVIPANIRQAFDSFFSMLRFTKNDTEAQESAVSLFINSLIGGANAPRIDDNKKNKIHLAGKTLDVDTAAYQAFFSRYSTNYNGVEIAEITGMYDVLIEEASRRFSGDFWTPTLWVNKAHAMLDEQLGEGWRTRYVVWDNSCGTKNLTRDYEDFTELYSSTLYQYELDTATIYNSESTAFQYDFLNDDIDLKPGILFGTDVKIDPKLYAALSEDKPIVFLMNPPYGTAANQGETSKAGAATNRVNEIMSRKDYSHATQQLYTQFLYRIMMLKDAFKLTNVVIGIFSNDRFMNGTKSFGRFMEDFQNDFVFTDGIFFNAGEFSDVSTNWGISYTIWKSRTVNDGTLDEFPLDIYAADGAGLHRIGQKIVRNTPEAKTLNKWVTELIPKERGASRHEVLPLSGALKTYSGSAARQTRLLNNALGYFQSNSNTVEHSSKYTALYSSAFGSGNGSNVLPQNFERVMAAFAVRKANVPRPELMWVNGHDIFARPDADESSASWREFVADCVVYALANNSGSNQSALRSVAYQGATYNVYNEFFFMGRSEVRSLAQQVGNRTVLVDLNSSGSSERFVYEWLQEHSSELSAEATALLSALRDLVAGVMPLRSSYSGEQELYVQAWDAGYWQHYLLAKDAAPHLIVPVQRAFEAVEQRIAVASRRYKFIG